jgi:AmiR/NasT family two-component response regulator
MRETPNFAGWRVTILHREDNTTERLTRQLRLLGLVVSVQWEPLADRDLPDIIIVDADQGWTGLLPWKDGDAPKPLIALLGSEAPGRIAWAMEQGAGAIIAKPLASSAVYPALVMALGIHRERKAVIDRVKHLEERVRMRPLVHAAVQRIMDERQVSEDVAYDALRNCAMRRRVPMEQVAASVLVGKSNMLETG